ncbi:hypothetical protein [Thaumasiovibrio sp. DFM-14]|uniref:hypothetical protein n=1 Tax=Thaumasiovibrio sp. DFM-14 TaxID=3384792 RepID=UPI0039A1B863
MNKHDKFDQTLTNAERNSIDTEYDRWPINFEIPLADFCNDGLGLSADEERLSRRINAARLTGC